MTREEYMREECRLWREYNAARKDAAVTREAADVLRASELKNLWVRHVRAADLGDRGPAGGVEATARAQTTAGCDPSEGGAR